MLPRTLPFHPQRGNDRGVHTGENENASQGNYRVPHTALAYKSLDPPAFPPMHVSPDTPVSPAPLRVVLVEDHPIFLAGLKNTFGQNPDFTLVGDAVSAPSARVVVRDTRPDLVVMDLLLGNASGLTDGLGLLADLRYENRTLKILVISSVEDSSFAARAIRAGADGFVVKSEPAANLLAAVTRINTGGVYLSPFLAVALNGQHRPALDSELSQRFGMLTNRELHVLHATALGMPNRRIAEDLGISVKTIETHKEALKRKLGLLDATELARAAEHYLNALRG